MPATGLPYPSEEALVDEFCELLRSNATPWGTLQAIREFSYVRGRADVVAVDVNGQIIAFEAKLTKWRHGLQQAYRNTCFAHQSYLILPGSASTAAEQYQHEFTRRSVGLCTVQSGEITVHLPAVHQQPIQPWLSEKAVSTARGQQWPPLTKLT